MSSGLASCAGRSFDLPARLLQELVRHAQDCLPEECCGVLIGSETRAGRSRIHRTVAAENTRSHGRERAYLVPPLAILEARRAARADDLEIVGYYHSHPSGSATPSALDRRNAWPDTSYVILGMDAGELRGVRSWRLGPGDTGFVEERLNCEEDRK